MIRRSFIFLLLAMLGVTAGISACGKSQPNADGRPVAVATIFAYYDILRSVGGDKINSGILLPPSTSPHEFAPTVSDRNIVETAQLLVKNGLGLDDWLDKLANGTKARILNIGQDVSALRTQEISLDAPKGASSGSAAAINPHIWLDPMIQIRATQIIRDALIKLDPANQATYTANAVTYIAQLRQLDTDFQAAAATFVHKDFIGFHSAYDYLAHRYGLRQVASIEEVPEAGLSPAQFQRVIDLIKKEHVPVVFTEDAFPTQAADSIVRETGVKRGILQPLETYTSLDDTYVSLMRQNLAELQRTLGQ